MEKKEREKMQKFIDKVDNMKKKNKLDLSSDQDLTIAIMNLISIEEHFFFSGAKTGNEKYFPLIEEARSIRKQLLAKIVDKTTDGSETWCISKHLLAASMRLMEVGTKQQSMGNTEEAYDLFYKAYNLYSLFWGLNLNLIDLGSVKKSADDDMQIQEIEVSKTEENDKPVSKVTIQPIQKKGLSGMLGKMVQKLVDCCLE